MKNNKNVCDNILNMLTFVDLVSLEICCTEMFLSQYKYFFLNVSMHLVIMELVFFLCNTIGYVLKTHSPYRMWTDGSST